MRAMAPRALVGHSLRGSAVLHNCRNTGPKCRARALLRKCFGMDPRLNEFHCIMPFSNIASVMPSGILSYERAAKLPHTSVAMQPVQDRRDQKQVPGGMRLHQYANLYFHARNPMLYKRLNEAHNLCVIRVSTQILQLQGTVVSDQNAASDYVRFYHPSQVDQLPLDDIYREDWTHDDKITYWRRKSRKCAEALVPQSVSPQYFLGAYVINQAAAQNLQKLGFHLPISVNSPFFFQ